MADGALAFVERNDRELPRRQSVESCSDGELLRRFATGRDEDAFNVLVQRHGAMVHDQCLRVLGNPHDADDVFQATFLVLARKAGEIVWQESVRGWLKVAAQRLAWHARSARRTGSQRTIAAFQRTCEPSYSTPDQDVELADQRCVIDAELLEIPEKYRAPLTLCYLEGMSNEEAARELGWPTGSISRRLARGRELLRERPRMHGLAVSFGILFGLLLAIALANWLAPVRTDGQLIAHSSETAKASMVAELMRPLGPIERGGHGIELALQQLERDGMPLPELDRDRLMAFAYHTARIAERIKQVPVDHDPEQWVALSDNMQRSAVELAEAVRDDRVQAAGAAVRNLNRTCSICHLKFRKQ